MMTMSLTSLPPLEFQKDLCLAPTRAWHGKTWKPPKISELIFDFLQINISSEATEAVSKANSAFIITISKLFLCTLWLTEHSHSNWACAPFYQQKAPQATEKLLHSCQTGRELLFHSGITFIDFPKLEVHLLNWKPNLGENRSIRGKKNL